MAGFFDGADWGAHRKAGDERSSFRSKWYTHAMARLITQRPYSPLAVANYFLDLAEREGQTLDPMKLQKLVYIAHGWCLAIYGDALIDEPVEAWQFGPVISTLYHEFKEFGADPIKRRAFDIQPAPRWPRRAVYQPHVPVGDAETTELLEQVWDTYGGFSALELSSFTHRAGTPWFETWQGRGSKRRGIDIGDDLIKQHFLALARARSA